MKTTTAEKDRKPEVKDVEVILTDMCGRPGENDMTPEMLQVRAATASHGYKILSWEPDNMSYREFELEILSFYEGFLEALKSERALS